MDGYHVLQKDRVDSEGDKTSEDTVAVKLDTAIVKKEKRERSSFDLELSTWNADVFVGLGNHTTFIYGGAVSYKGLGAYIDLAQFGKGKYASTGIYYDVLRKVDRHSLELGVSFWGNYHGTYKYLFKRHGDVYYLGINVFHIPNSKFEDYEYTRDKPENYQTVSGGFLPIQVVFGVRFLDEWPSLDNLNWGFKK